MSFRARAVVINDGRLAVIKRLKGGRAYAVLPGGKVEADETPQQAAVRELTEETALQTRVERLLWHDDLRQQMYFLMAPVGGQLQLIDGPELDHAGPDNVYDPAWVRATELDDIGLQPVEIRDLIRPLMGQPSPIEVIGLPAAGWNALGEDERAILASAEVVFGDGRQLGLLPERPDQEQVRWPRHLRDQLPMMLDDHAGRRIVVLASGDPLLAGIGSTLVELLGPDEVRIHPAVSSASLARARLGWSAESCEVVRVINPAADELVGRLTPGRRLIVLSRDAETPAAVARLLIEEGFGASELVIFGDLGTTTESRVDTTARAEIGPGPRLNLVCIRCLPERARPTWSAVPGLPDDAYEHDGQLTKRVQRAAALAHLRPAPGELLWDLGAGAGSISVEWCRAAPRAWAYAVEHDPARAERISANARKLGATVTVVTAEVKAAIADLPAPDAIFIGGGACPSVITAGLAALKPGGRMVMHAVTVETEAVLVQAMREHGGDLVRVGVEQLTPLGSFHGWEPARAIVQWSLQRPWSDDQP